MIKFSDESSKKINMTNVLKSLSIVAELIKREIQVSYADTHLGFLLFFINNLLTIFVMTFVFKYGLKLNGFQQVPFILWVLPAQAAWIYFSTCVNRGAVSISTYDYLVKKIPFNTYFIPFIVVGVNAFLHLLYLVIVVIWYFVSGKEPTIYWVQVIYYFFSATVLLLALIYFFSALNVFFKDIAHFLGVIISYIMWITPIYWDSSVLSGRIFFAVKLNPCTYIVNGYRDSFLSRSFFWNNLGDAVYFWIFTLGLLLVSLAVFRRFRPYFADVL
jgi:ABC-type polysaccharide/polyol phosphate export permease